MTMYSFPQAEKKSYTLGRFGVVQVGQDTCLGLELLAPLGKNLWAGVGGRERFP